MSYDPGQPLPYALCEIDDVKEMLGGNFSGQSDALIQQLINHFSDFTQSRELANRTWVYQEHTEIREGGRCWYAVQAPPINMSEPIMICDWGVLQIENQSIHIDPERGIVKHVLGGFRPGSRTVQLKYFGGLVKPDPNDPTHPPVERPMDLRIACATQVSFWFKNRNDMGMQAVSIAGAGAVAISEPTKLLPMVVKTVMKYRRFD